jgi:hypothetical protein
VPNLDAQSSTSLSAGADTARHKRPRLAGDDVDTIRGLAKTLRIVGIAWFGFVVALLLGNGSARFGWEGVGVAGPIAVQGVLLFLAARPMRRAVRKGRAHGRSLARAATLLTWVFVISTIGSVGYTVATAGARISASGLLSTESR